MKPQLYFRTTQDAAAPPARNLHTALVTVGVSRNTSMLPSRINTFSLMAKVMRIQVITGSDEPIGSVIAFARDLPQQLARGLDFFAANRLGGGEREKKRGGGCGVHRDRVPPPLQVDRALRRACRTRLHKVKS